MTTTTSTENASTLTIEQVEHIYNQLRRVLFVHPSDAQHGVVAELRKTGIDIETRPHMPRGYGYLQETDIFAVIDLSKGEAYMSKRDPFSFGAFGIGKPPCSE